MVAQEVMHHIHKSKSKQGLLATKINLEKAYDKYSWDFLQATLEDFGSLNKTIQLIMFCVRFFSLSLIWNVTKLSSFVSNKGLQKGDPLFPYHFVLGMKKLFYLMFNKVAGKTRKSMHLSRSGPNISYLFLLLMIFYFSQRQIILRLVSYLMSYLIFAKHLD